MKQEILEVLTKLLSYKTYKDNTEEFSKLFKFIKDNYSNLYIEEYRFNDKTSLVLSNTKSKDLDIIFCTHIDVVYAKDYSYKIKDNNIYGRGTIDMKASVAVILTLLKYINTDKKIGLFITSDEETSGNGAKELVKMYNTKIAIVPDGGSNFELIIEEKGILQLELSINTKPAHASQLFNGENAIVKLMNIYDKIIEKYPLPKNSKEYITSVNLSKLNGGLSNNQVPDYATMILDIRVVGKDKIDNIIKFIKKLDKDLKVNVLIKGDTFKTNIKNKYVKQYIKASEKVLNKKLVYNTCESASDANFFYEANIPTVIMNPDGYYAHCDNEYVNIDSLEILYNIYVEFINNFKE